jgi:hypothetical protein
MPLFWLLWIGALGFDLPLWDRIPHWFLAVFGIAMVSGHVVMWATAGIALGASGRARLLPWLVLLGLYWQLGAVAAYWAIAELFYAPFFWNKTAHGDDAADPDVGA